MRPRFCPHRFIIFSLLLLCVCPFLLAGDKKGKDSKSAAQAKSTPKPESKTASKNTRDAHKEKELSKKDQLAQKKKTEPDKNGKNAKNKTREADKVTKNQPAEKTRTEQKDKAAKREADKKSEQKLARNTEKKKEETKKKDDAKKKDEVAAIKSQTAQDKLVKSVAKTEPKRELKAESKNKTDKQEAKAKPEKKVKEVSDNESGTFLAKSLVKAAAKPHKTLAKTESQPVAPKEEPIKQLPTSKFTLRPVTKVTPRVELKFTIAKALATSFDPPPPTEPSDPDVIEVIESDSPEIKKLDEIYRQEVKALNYSNIPNTSNKRIDIKKMDAERIGQIQEALQKRGYYIGEINGVYDDATVEAMRKFQSTNKIDVTGYATAHTLKLLGLTDWERSFE